VILARVQCGDVSQLAATGGDIGSRPAYLDFFESLQAIGGKTGADDIDFSELVLPPFDEHIFRVWLEPLFPPDTRLKTDLPLLIVQFQFGGNQSGCLLALTVIRISVHEDALRQAVKGHQQSFALSVDVPEITNAGDEGGNVTIRIVIVIDESEFGDPASL